LRQRPTTPWIRKTAPLRQSTAKKSNIVKTGTATDKTSEETKNGEPESGTNSKSRSNAGATICKGVERRATINKGSNAGATIGKGLNAGAIINSGIGSGNTTNRGINARPQKVKDRSQGQQLI
jgi:hypothetical protein